MFFRKKKKPFEHLNQKEELPSHDTLFMNEQNLYLGVFHDNIRGPIHVSIRFEDRYRHVVLFGGTGMGKSTLLVNMMVQDMHAGHGFCFIDPKGDAVEEVLARVPEHRINDVILIDPANYDKVVGLNFLEVPKKGLSEIQINAIKEVVVSDLVALMKQQTQIWGERFGRIFETLIRAMLDHNEKAGEEDQLTFLDLYILLTDEDIRNRFAESVNDPIIREYLLKVNEMQDDVMEPVIRRLNDWVMNKVARQIVAHRKSSFDFREAIDTNKIILVRIPKGEVGDTIMQLVGTTILSKIWAAAKSRVDIPQDERRPFFLYIDEFKNFAFEDSTFDDVLSEARAFRLGLVLATQYPSQLSREIREAVYGNCGTIIAFNPQNPNDAQALIKRFPNVRIEDMLSLGLYTVMLRLMVSNELSDPFVISTYPPIQSLRSREDIEAVARKSLGLYGKERMSEMDLSASLRRIKEICRISPKEGFIDDMIELLYCCAIRSYEEIDYKKFATEAMRRSITVSEQQFANLIEIFESMELVELRSELKTGKVKIKPDLSKIRPQFWNGKFGATVLSGLIDHRRLVERVYEFFVKMGFIVQIPVKKGEYMPDLELKYPAVSNLAEAKNVRDEMVRTGAWQLTKGKDAVVEIETTTQTRPGQLLSKLKRAHVQRKYIIFVTLGSGSSLNEYYSSARYILQVLTQMRGFRGFYKTSEVEKDYRGRKLWEHKSTGEVAYESNGVLYNAKNNETECAAREATGKGWVTKKKVFDPVKEFGSEIPEMGRDYSVLVFPPDNFDFPVISVIKGGAGFRLLSVVPRMSGYNELTEELAKTIRKHQGGQKDPEESYKEFAKRMGISTGRN